MPLFADYYLEEDSSQANSFYIKCNISETSENYAESFELWGLCGGGEGDLTKYLKNQFTGKMKSYFSRGKKLSTGEENLVRKKNHRLVDHALMMTFYLGQP